MKIQNTILFLYKFFLSILTKINEIKSFYFIITLNLVSVLLDLVSVSLIIPIIIILSGNISDMDNNLLNYYQKLLSKYELNTQIMIISIIIILIALFKFFFDFFSKYELNKLNIKFSQFLSRSTFEKFLEAKLIFIESLTIGEIRTRLMQFPGKVSIILNNVIILFSSIILVLLYMILMFLISFKLTFFVIIFFSIILIITSFFIRVINRRGALLDKYSVFLTQLTSEIIKTIKIIKLYNAKKKIKIFLEKAYENNKNALLNLSFIQLLNNPTLTFISSVLISLFFISTIFVKDENQILWLQTTLILLFILVRMLSPISNINSARIIIASNLNALNLLNEFIEKLNSNKENPNILKDFEFKNNIKFKNVSLFFSNNKKFALKNINTVIKKGEFTSIIGMSGSGKSSFINVLAKLYDPTKGIISIDDKPLNEIGFHAWSDKISFIPQEKLLYNYSIRDNIVLSNSLISQKKILQVIKFCQLSKLINSLPNGIETIVGEDGNNFSGGQIQRIILARALIKDSEILIFDEATNELDPINENYIFSILKKLRKKKTIIVITHKTRYLPLSDKILVLNNGKIIEEGNYEMLISMGFISKIKKLEKVINK